MQATSLRKISNLIAYNIGLEAEAKRDGVATSFQVDWKTLQTMLKKLPDSNASRRSL